MREEFKFDHKEDSSIGDLLLFKSKDFNLYIAKRDKKDFDMLEFKKFFMGLSKEEINENMYMILFEDNTGITLTHNSYTMIMGYGKLPDEYAKELDGLKDYENKVYNIEQDMIYNFEEQIMYIMDENKFGTVRLKEHDSVLAPIVEGEEYIKEE
ncbi:MAG: hypothetical protein Q4P31_07450 [Andreesenia angusta]|nr:hypothetical protein [Andreesenia angusta]